MFSQKVAERIGYYVYCLVDPRTNLTFYIGKGKGNRIFDHVKGIAEGSDDNEKISLINNIMNDGQTVKCYIIKFGLSEAEALLVEAALIDYLGLDNLTNEVSGHGGNKGRLLSTEEIESLYAAEEAEITEPVILVNINRLYRWNIEDDELYNATREWWVIGPRRRKAMYALATYRGIVREVYRIKGWNSRKMDNGKVRWAFEGELAESEIRKKYKDHSVLKYVKVGAQNPIKYVNC